MCSQLCVSEKETFEACGPALMYSSIDSGVYPLERVIYVFGIVRGENPRRADNPNLEHISRSGFVSGTAMFTAISLLPWSQRSYVTSGHSNPLVCVMYRTIS